MFDIKSGEDLTILYLKSDVILSVDVFEKIIKISSEEYGNNPLYYVSIWLHLAMWIEIY